MGNDYEQQVSDSNNHSGFGFGLQIVMSFIRNFINQFKVTEQDLIDAGVISAKGRYDRKIG